MDSRTEQMLEALGKERYPEPDVRDIVSLLALTEEKDLQRLFETAYAVKLRHVGNKVRLRGLIEIGNICTKDCFYCGIRKSNAKVHRYEIGEDRILSEARWAMENGFASLAIQSGERNDEKFISFIEHLLKRLMREMPSEPGITLSLGEQTFETYKRWFDAGAKRYLLRIEASNPELYRKLHPSDHFYEKRVECLNLIRKSGLQLGTGVMMGLPFQTLEDTANDILFFKKVDADMIGMGPYIVHDDTPLSAHVRDFNPQKQLVLGLKTIAVTRLVLRDVNIASTTALQALDPDGRRRGLLAGANVIMPNATEQTFRESYQLYRGKPGLDDTPGGSLKTLIEEVASAGETIGFNEWGDSPHFKAKKNLESIGK